MVVEVCLILFKFRVLRYDGKWDGYIIEIGLVDYCLVMLDDG